MKHRLYILEGADGTGKSTLATALLEKTKGHLLHGTFHKDWDILTYHTAMLHSAARLLQYQDVILDRWAVSEEVYAKAFGRKLRTSADEFMEFMFAAVEIDNICFIYCENEQAVENHKANMKLRPEMYDDMGPVVEQYNNYLKFSKFKWNRYDFTKVNMDEFVEGITK